MPFEALASRDRTLDLFDVETPAKMIAERHRPRQISIGAQTLTTTAAFDAYWYFARARQDIFHNRVRGQSIRSNLPVDPILQSFRFTNAYRASDRVSQYLINDVQGAGDDDWSPDNLFFRTILFKIFNKIETWEAIKEEFGEPCLDSFAFGKADRYLTSRQDQKLRNYSAAYIMPSAGAVFGHRRKHSNHLALIQWMLGEEYPTALSRMTRMADAYALMLNAPSLGPFLAYQFVTDLNYSTLTNFSETEFVVAGPGALDGISKCFESTDGLAAELVIQHMVSHQAQYFSEYGHEFRDLWGRPLQLIDCQNLFCEVSKYTRVAFPSIEGVAQRTRIKQTYKRSDRAMRKPRYPKKWNIVVQ